MKQPDARPLTISSDGRCPVSKAYRNGHTIDDCRYVEDLLATATKLIEYAVSDALDGTDEFDVDVAEAFLVEMVRSRSEAHD